MYLINRLNYSAWLFSGTALGALALLWFVYDTPLQATRFIRADALSAFFLFVVFGGLATAAVAQPQRGWPYWSVLAALVLLVNYLATSTLLIAAGYFALALLMTPSIRPGRMPFWPFPALLRALGAYFQKVLLVAPAVLAGLCLLLGYSLLAWSGAWLYSDRMAGASLNGFTFGFVLLAATIPASSLLRTEYLETMVPASDATAGRSISDGLSTAARDVLRVAWLYPLVRLYSLGPWNSGWSFATLLLGGAAALWSAQALFADRDARKCLDRGLLIYLGFALAGFGLSSSAGIVAGCYAVLSYVVLSVGGHVETIRHEGSAFGSGSEQDSAQPTLEYEVAQAVRWMLSGVVPFTAPFIAAWMLISAAAAGGIALLSGVVWLALLLKAVSTGLVPEPRPSRRRRIAAGISLVLGVLSPIIVRMLILPVVQQLQGGLTPYGDINVWPWVGIATDDAAHTRVATLPSIAVVGLMIVLSALVYLLGRLRELLSVEVVQENTERATDARQKASPSNRLLERLRAEVPWLGSGGYRPPAEENDVDP